MRIFGIDWPPTRRQEEKGEAETLSSIVSIEVAKSRQATSDLRDTLRGVLERRDKLTVRNNR